MKIEHHLRKIERMSKTIEKLDYEEDYETLIEDYMLLSSHLVNAAMHKLGTLKPDKDIKHNRLFGHIKNEKSLKDKSDKIAELVQDIEQLRPSHVYGKGENGETAKKAEEYFKRIKEICKKIIEGKNEGKSSDSS